MKIIKVKIRRTDEQGADIGFKEYEIRREPRDTVLHALTYIYSKVDSTLAFRYSCRFKKCGLCAVLISGKPRLACLTTLENGMKVEPLSNLPVIRDLAVDRRQLFDQLRSLSLFPITKNRANNSLKIPDRYYNLSACLECLCCHSQCTAFKDEPEFVGPFAMVKLAQMHFHPQDFFDRRKQAKDLGMDRCLKCAGCFCPYGINITRDVIQPLLA